MISSLSVFSPFSHGTLPLTFCQMLELVLETVPGMLMVLHHCSLQEMICEVPQGHHTVLMNVRVHGHYPVWFEVVGDHGLVVKMILGICLLLEIGLLHGLAHGLVLKVILGIGLLKKMVLGQGLVLEIVLRQALVLSIAVGPGQVLQMGLADGLVPKMV